MIQVAVVGFGYWGPNLVRNFLSMSGAKVHSIVERDESRFQFAQKLYPTVEVTKNLDAVLNNPAIDAVVIALPVYLHFEVARQAFAAGKHVLIEKPMTGSVEQAERLIELAQKQNKVLMVDHTFLYTGAVKKIKQLVNDGELGDIQYFDSTRINLGLFQRDINVIWDLAPHDLSILNYLIEEAPVSISATGISHTGNHIENIAYVTIHYQRNCIAHLNLSWTSPVKIRSILLGGSKKMVVYNDIEPSEKVKIYDSGYKVSTREEENKLLIDYRTGDIHIPKLDNSEALQGVAADFIKSVQHGSEPLANWRSGLAVVKMLEAAEKSIKNRGAEIKL